MEQEKQYIQFERRVINNGYSYALNLPKVWMTHTGIKRRDKILVLWDKETNCLIIRKIQEDKRK